MEMFRLFIFSFFAVILSIYDVKFLKVPSIILFVQSLALIIFDFLFFRNRMLQNTIGAISCFAVLLTTYFVSKRNLGFGDVKFGLSVGWLLGNWQWIPALFMATVLGISFILVKRHGTQNVKIPFVPFLGFSTLCISVLYDSA